MATCHPTRSRRARPDELVVHDDQVDWIRFEGTREALIARAGVPAECFDEACRVSKNIWRTVVDERRIEIRRTSPHRFLVYYGRTPQERERRAAERDAQRKAEETRRVVEETIKHWPNDPEAWRRLVERLIGFDLRCMSAVINGAYLPGFRFENDAAAEIQLHLQAIRGLVETSTVVADPGSRQRREAALREQVVSADPRLARFMVAAGVRHG